MTPRRCIAAHKSIPIGKRPEGAYEGVLAFYQKNGFLQNAELYNKNRKTISMRKDLYR
jgi:hypothetical protein